MTFHALANPLLLPADRLGEHPVRDIRAEQRLEGDSRHDLVDVGGLEPPKHAVAQHQTVIGIEQRERFGNGLDRVHEPLSGAGFPFPGFDLGGDVGADAAIPEKGAAGVENRFAAVA